jgi:molecular chaperone DnaK (HSP70)
MDTIAYETEDGRLVFAEEARRAAENNSNLNGLLRNFKMDLLSEEMRPLAVQRMQQLFEYIYEKYQEKRRVMYGQGEAVRTRVSYPAKWPPQLRQATIEAARKAGFPDVEGMDEPTAAMQFFLAHRTGALDSLFRERLFSRDQPLNVLLIDLGAGTTDIVVFRGTPGKPEDHEILGV